MAIYALAFSAAAAGFYIGEEVGLRFRRHVIRAWSEAGARRSTAEIPQRLIRQVFELDADFVEALWALDQLAEARARFLADLPRRARPLLSQPGLRPRDDVRLPATTPSRSWLRSEP